MYIPIHVYIPTYIHRANPNPLTRRSVVAVAQRLQRRGGAGARLAPLGDADIGINPIFIYIYIRIHIHTYSYIDHRLVLWSVVAVAQRLKRRGGAGARLAPLGDADIAEIVSLLLYYI